jgi:ubiquinone/menaquinone biosynthesis C-methylase UbiE
MNHLQHNAVAHDKIFKKFNLKHAEIYNDIEQEGLNRLVERIKGLSGKGRPRVLDVGAGTGNLALKFLTAGRGVVASDVSTKSMEMLEKTCGGDSFLETALITGEDPPFADETSDVVVTYSVLHHVPDYLNTVKEIIRVSRTGGLILIDHEANENKWAQPQALKEYCRRAGQTPLDYAKKIVRNGEFATFSFFKAVLMNLFVDKRHKREGDIHVWPDDHLDWDRIREVVRASGVRVIGEDYLLFRPKGGEPLYRL